MTTVCSAGLLKTNRPLIRNSSIQKRVPELNCPVLAAGFSIFAVAASIELRISHSLLFLS
jgi:hypothetical protein